MKIVTAFVKNNMLTDIISALHKFEGLTGASFSEIRGFGKTYGKEGTDYSDNHPHTRIEISCKDSIVNNLVSTIQEKANTGLRGDGKIFVSTVEEVIRISTGEKGESAI